MGGNTQDAIPWTGSGESVVLAGGHRVRPCADGATGGGLMAFVRTECVQGMQKTWKKAKTAAPAPISLDFVTEYPDQERFSNVFSASS